VNGLLMQHQARISAAICGGSRKYDNLDIAEPVIGRARNPLTHPGTACSLSSANDGLRSAPFRPCGVSLGDGRRASSMVEKRVDRSRRELMHAVVTGVPLGFLLRISRTEASEK